jgi:hypothetical protein
VEAGTFLDAKENRFADTFFDAKELTSKPILSLASKKVTAGIVVFGYFL